MSSLRELFSFHTCNFTRLYRTNASFKKILYFDRTAIMVKGKRDSLLYNMQALPHVTLSRRF